MCRTPTILPLELMREILSFVDLMTWVSLRLTNRKWNLVCMDNVFFNEIKKYMFSIYRKVNRSMTLTDGCNISSRRVLRDAMVKLAYKTKKKTVTSHNHIIRDVAKMFLKEHGASIEIYDDIIHILATQPNKVQISCGCDYNILVQLEFAHIVDSNIGNHIIKYGIFDPPNHGECTVEYWNFCRTYTPICLEDSMKALGEYAKFVLTKSPDRFVDQMRLYI